MLMAGLDGIKNKLHPGDAMDKDLYDLPPKELKKIPTVCGSLREALMNLDKDRDFLKVGGVFDDDFIDSYIELKMQRGDPLRAHPASGRVRDVLLGLSGTYDRDDKLKGRSSERPFCFSRSVVFRHPQRLDLAAVHVDRRRRAASARAARR